MVTTETERPVLVLGAGIHGAAIARELLLNGLSVVLVDQYDIASGATSKSSRLIHGGLRYLEYGDVRLVRESLQERRRNLDLAPCFVTPLRLYIPVSTSLTGLLSSAVGFFGGHRTAVGKWLARGSRNRGFWPVRTGLKMYDWLARDDALPASSAVSLTAPGVPRVEASRYRALLAYSDAQMRYPERVVVSLLADAAEIARTSSLSFHLATYGTLKRQSAGWELTSPLLKSPLWVDPCCIVNACGAGNDQAATALGMEQSPLMGGTKGSHLLTWHPELKAALQRAAVYAEAEDGRPVFTLPFGDGVLIGTTDEAFEGDPHEVVASEQEIAYLLRMVRQVFGIELSRDDVVAHYSGVRPLPRVDVAFNAAISRDHHLELATVQGIPCITLVGGKLTTWRALAEEVTSHVLEKRGQSRVARTTERKLPGNNQVPTDPLVLQERWAEWALEAGTGIDEVARLWELMGTQAQSILQAVAQEPVQPVADSPLTTRTVRELIRREYVTSLNDLVERRLLSVFQRDLSRQHLMDLADCLIATGRLDPAQREAAVDATAERLRRHYGRRIAFGS